MRLIHAVRGLSEETGQPIEVIALHTDVDRNATFVREADVAYDLGPAASRPYLNMKVLEHALLETGADAAWVGWGFVAEDPLFAELCDRIVVMYLGAVVEVMLEHAQRLCAWVDEPHGVRMFRKHATWYTKGFRGSARVRNELVRASTLEELRQVLARLDPDERFPPSAMRVPRGKTGGTQKVALPDGYLAALDDDTPPEAEDENDGG